jgi:hypothetical protein
MPLINPAVSRVFLRRRPEVVAVILIGKEGERRRARERRTATAGQSRVRTKPNTSFFLFVGAFASPHKGLDF